VVAFSLVTIGGGALLLASGFVGIHLGRRRGRPKNDVGVVTAVLLVAGFVLLGAAAVPFRISH
jgi:hypothetical protein